MIQNKIKMHFKGHPLCDELFGLFEMTGPYKDYKMGSQ